MPKTHVIIHGQDSFCLYFFVRHESIVKTVSFSFYYLPYIYEIH